MRRQIRYPHDTKWNGIIHAPSPINGVDICQDKKKLRANLAHKERRGEILVYDRLDTDTLARTSPSGRGSNGTFRYDEKVEIIKVVDHEVGLGECAQQQHESNYQ